MKKYLRIFCGIALCCLILIVNNVFSYAETSDIGSIEDIIADMTADEYFLVFGSSGGALNYDSDFSVECIADTLEMIRQEQPIESDNVTSENEKSTENGKEELTLLVAGSSMTTGTEGINLIKRWEGCRLTAYKALSTEQYYTIGYGHYGADVTAGMTITQAQADAMLVSDLKKFETYVNNYINSNGLKLNQNQFDALVSFTYNLGTQWMKGTNIPKMLTNGYERFEPQVVHDYFCEWSYSSHKFIQGLYNRREAESAVFLKPCYDVCAVTRVGLELGAQIGEIIYFSLTDVIANDTSSYIRVVHGNSITDYPICDIKTDNNNCRLKVSLPVKDALDTITAYIYSSSGQRMILKNGNVDGLYGYHFSVEEYEALVKLENNTELLNLIAAIKNYSRCSKAYFGQQDTSSYITSNITKDSFSSYARSCIGSIDGLKYEGMTLLLKDSASLRVYFSVDDKYSLDKFSFACNGQLIKAKCQSSVCYIEIANISAVDIDTMFTIKAVDSQGKNMTITAGALSYAYSVYDNDNISLEGLMSKMYEYNRAAKNYFK